MIQGKDVILSIDGMAVAAAQSCELDVDRDLIEVCSPVDGQWKRYIPSTIGWSASVSGLVVDMANPQAWLNEMKSSAHPLTMRYYDTELGIYQVGNVWIKSWKNGAQVGSLATFNLSLQGNGALNEPTYTTVDLSNPLYQDYPRVMEMVEGVPTITESESRVIKYKQVTLPKCKIEMTYLYGIALLHGTSTQTGIITRMPDNRWFREILVQHNLDSLVDTVYSIIEGGVYTIAFNNVPAGSRIISPSVTYIEIP